MRTNQFDLAIEGLVKDKKDTSITLKDGTVLTGRIKEFDGYVLVLDGEPMRMVYRHSILRLSEAIPARQEKPVRQERPAPRPDARKTASTADRPRTGPPRSGPERPPQRERRPSQDRRPQPMPAQTENVQMGIMGDAMQKWLKSQKGGE